MSDGPLSPEQRRDLSDANARAGKILGAARVSTFTAWSVGLFGALSLGVGLFGGGGVLVGAALLAVAWNEVRGRDRLRRLDPEGPRILGWNQLALLAVAAAYCLGAIWKARTEPGDSVRLLEELAGLPEGYVADLTTTAYVLVLGVVALVQWLLARYHFAREPMLRAYLEETPPWAVELQRESRLG